MTTASTRMGHFRIGTVVYRYRPGSSEADSRPIAMCLDIRKAQEIVDALDLKAKVDAEAKKRSRARRGEEESA